MFSSRYSGESDGHESQQNNHSATSQYSVLELDYSSDDLAILEQKNAGVYASGPHIVLMCGPYDDDVDCNI